jgi:hypothetical protein
MDARRGMGVIVQFHDGSNVDTQRVVMISDSYLMASDEPPSADGTVKGAAHRVETGQSAKDVAETLMKRDPSLALVRTAKRGGDYVNVEYIDDVHSYGITLTVDPHMMDPNVRTTYTGTEMSAQIEQSVQEADRRVSEGRQKGDSFNRKLPDVSDIKQSMFDGGYEPEWPW